MKTGAIITKKIRKTMETTAPQIHQVSDSRRTTPTSTTATIPPNTSFPRTNDDELVAEPGEESLGRQPVLPLTEIAFV